jgi:predicted porin
LEYFSMKKTLIALAVLAASGATFAQATITGSYAFGYAQTSGGGNAQKSGIGTDTAAVQFAASEDLGGGLKASAKVSFGGASRGTAVTGEDAALNLTGGFGSLTMGTVESGNGLLAIGSSGAAGYGLDGKVISGSSNIDVISYGLPLGGGFTLGASYVDRGATGATGLNEGSTGTSSAQPSYTLGVTYAAGPLAAKLDATQWARQDEVTGFIAKNRYRLSAAYDLGAVRLSAGYSNANTTNNLTTTETLIGIKVPLGAVTVGLDYAQNTKTNDQDVNGWSLGVGYALSKRTSINTSLASWKQSGSLATAAPVETSNGFRVLVAHSF